MSQSLRSFARSLFGFALPLVLVCSVGCPEGEGDGDGDDTVYEDPRTTPLRRLGQTEWNNTIRDLFDIETPPHYDFPGALEVAGFENNADFQGSSELAVESFRAAAVHATAVALPNLIPPCMGKPDERPCGRSYLEEFMPRAFRRPVTDEEVDSYAAFFDAMLEDSDFMVAYHLVTQAVLQSPDFLFRPEFGVVSGSVEAEELIPLGPYEIATRLSYFLWSSMPDEELFAAAASGELDTPDGVEAQARRMLSDEKARESVRDFHRQWLNLDEVEDIQKDGNFQPLWDFQARDEMGETAARFGEWVFFDGPGTWDGLMTESRMPVTGITAPIMGVDGSMGENWEVVEAPGRHGILTDPGILSITSHGAHPSPTLRGLYILDRFLCADPPPPLPGLAIFPPRPQDFSGQTTNRERYESFGLDSGCAGCHDTMHGIGFTLETFDMLGVPRDNDFGQPIDDSGELIGTDSDGPLDGAFDMIDTLAQSEQVQRCYARQWFRFGFGRLDDSGDLETIDQVHQGWMQQGGGDLQELLVSFVRSDAFRNKIAAGWEGDSR